MDLDRDGIRQIERIGRLAFDQLGEHGNVREQRADVTDDHACLFRIGGYDENCSSLTGCEEFSILIEAGQEDCTQRKDEGLASAPPTHQPGLGRRLLRWLTAAGALLENGELIVCHLQSEQRSEECAPSGPSGRIAEEPGSKQIRISHGLENIHRGPSTSSSVRLVASK